MCEHKKICRTAAGGMKMDCKRKNNFEELVKRIPELSFLLEKFNLLTQQIVDLYKRDGILYLAGNGGSCCDCEHIAGELLKGFKRKRPMAEEDIARFRQAFGEKGEYLASRLQQGLRAFSLNSHPGLVTAFGNDVDGNLSYAQQLYAMGRKGDVFLGISTGGNAANIEAAMMTAKMLGITTILLTGNKHGICEKYADIVIDVPSSETYRIQEFHLAIYHTLCLEVEEAFFDI